MLGFYFFRIQEDHPIMSFTLSKCGHYALLNIANQVCALIFKFYNVCMYLNMLYTGNTHVGLDGAASTVSGTEIQWRHSRLLYHTFFLWWSE